MLRRPPRSTRTDTLFPYTTLFRSFRPTRGPQRGVDIEATTTLPFRQAVDGSTVTLGVEGRRVTARIPAGVRDGRSEEHTSELQSLMRISYAVFCLKKKTKTIIRPINQTSTTKIN